MNQDRRGVIGRRAMLSAAGGAALGTLARSRPAAAESVAVPVGVWGGVMDETVRGVAVPQFTARYPDASLQLTVRGAADAYPRLLVSRDHPPESAGMWTNTFSALGGRVGLFQPFSDALVPDRKELLPALQPADGLGIAFAVQPYGIAYNPKYVEKPTSWLDLFNPKYEGKVAVIDNFWDCFVMLSRVLGKDEHNIEIAFDEFAKHKKNIGIFTTTFPQLEELLDKGEMWLGPHWGGFATSAQRRGLNIAFAWPKEGCTQASVIAHTNKNVAAPVNEMAQRFVDIWLTADFQQALLEKACLSPTNRTVSIAPELAALEGVITEERLKTHPLIQYDYAYMAQRLPEVTRMFREKLR